MSSLRCTNSPEADLHLTLFSSASDVVPSDSNPCSDQCSRKSDQKPSQLNWSLAFTDVYCRPRCWLLISDRATWKGIKRSCACSLVALTATAFRGLVQAHTVQSAASVELSSCFKSPGRAGGFTLCLTHSQFATVG